MVDALWKPNLVVMGWEGVIKGQGKGLDDSALSGGVGSRLPPKHEVSTPVNPENRW